MSLAALFARFKDNSSGHTFTVALVPGFQDVYLGTDIDDHPILFVRALEGSLEPPLRTNKVSLRLGQTYSVVGVNELPRSELLHALYCEASEEADVATFLLLAEAFLAGHEGSSLDQNALTSFFRSMVSLFAVTPARDLRSEQQGLWGELFTMSRVRGFRFWVPFWHSEVDRRFDFSCGRDRVEVKTTVGSERTHHFSHRQIFAIEGEEIIIASLVMRQDDTGLSLRQLIAECRTALHGTHDFLKLEKAVRRAGMEHSSESGPSFDAAEAGMSLAWFRSSDVPHFRIPEPPGVSETRYRVNFSTAPQVAGNALDEWLQSWTLEVAVNLD